MQKLETCFSPALYGLVSGAWTCSAISSSGIGYARAVMVCGSRGGLCFASLLESCHVVEQREFFTDCSLRSNPRDLKPTRPTGAVCERNRRHGMPPATHCLDGGDEFRTAASEGSTVKARRPHRGDASKGVNRDSLDYFFRCRN